jgi:hypothetical protein
MTQRALLRMFIPSNTSLYLPRPSCTRKEGQLHAECNLPMVCALRLASCYPPDALNRLNLLICLEGTSFTLRTTSYASWSPHCTERAYMSTL